MFLGAVLHYPYDSVCHWSGEKYTNASIQQVELLSNLIDTFLIDICITARDSGPPNSA